MPPKKSALYADDDFDDYYDDYEEEEYDDDEYDQEDEYDDIGAINGRSTKQETAKQQHQTIGSSSSKV